LAFSFQCIPLHQKINQKGIFVIIKTKLMDEVKIVS